MLLSYVQQGHSLLCMLLVKSCSWRKSCLLAGGRMQKNFHIGKFFERASGGVYVWILLHARLELNAPSSYGLLVLQDSWRVRKNRAKGYGKAISLVCLLVLQSHSWLNVIRLINTCLASVCISSLLAASWNSPEASAPLVLFSLLQWNLTNPNLWNVDTTLYYL